MAAFKPLLKLDQQSALERCVDLFKSEMVDNISVICGHNHSKIVEAVSAFDINCIFNPYYQEGMFSSIVAGLKSVGDQCHSFFILPVDIPLVRPATVRHLIYKFKKFKPAVCYPVFNRHRGHPPLISTSLIPEIFKWQGGGGLAGFLRSKEPLAMDVPVADEAVLLDMDRPADYNNLIERTKHYYTPTLKECRALMRDVYQTTDRVQAHCNMVARVSKRVGEALNAAGLALNLQTLEAAARVHDLARGQPDHAVLGSTWLNQWGFETVAPLVANHMDLNLDPEDSLNESQVLYLSDKLVSEDRLVDLDLRFQIKLDQHGHKPGVAEHICARWRTADAIRKRIISIVGSPLEKILLPIFQHTDSNEFRGKDLC